MYGVPDPRSGDRVMAALEFADPAAFDGPAFAEFLSAQPDLGRKDFPRLLRISANLPVTGSNKILKNQLRAESWHTTDSIYQCPGRTAPDYQPMSDTQKTELDAEFAAFDRQRFL